MTITSLAWIVLAVSAPAQTPGDTPLACNLNTLTHDERERHHKLTGKVFSAVVQRRELGDGYNFRLDPSRLSIAELGEWVGYEHRCCPFFRFRVEVDEAGNVWLALTGREGVKSFIEAEFRK